MAKQDFKSKMKSNPRAVKSVEPTTNITAPVETTKKTVGRPPLDPDGKKKKDYTKTVNIAIPLDTLDKIIYDSIYLSIDIQSNLLYYKTNDILGRIEEIVNLGGTKEIRELVEKEINLSIEPWIIENLNGSIEI